MVAKINKEALKSSIARWLTSSCLREYRCSRQMGEIFNTIIQSIFSLSIFEYANNYRVTFYY